MASNGVNFQAAGGVVVQASYTGGTNQAAVELAFYAGAFSVQLTPTGGTAKMQASNDGVNWIDWDAGNVSVSTISILSHVRYIRVVHTTASASALTVWGA